MLEDGAPREVKSFRLVEGAPAEAALATPGSGVVQPDPLRRVTLVSLVFDHLGQNARKLAQKAAQDYLKKPLPAGPVGGGVLARQPAAHAAGLLAQRRRAVRGGRSRDDRGRQGGRGAAAGREPGAGGPSSTARPTAAGARANPATAGADAVGAADARDDRADADAGDEHRDVAARPRDVLSADGAGQGAGRPRRPQGDPALLGGPAGAQLRSRRSSRRRSAKPTAPTSASMRSTPAASIRAATWPPPARRSTRPGASASRRWPSAAPAARRWTKCRTTTSCSRRSSPARSRCCASWPRTPAAR